MSGLPWTARDDRAAERGSQDIERFLGEAPEEMDDIQPKLTELRTSIEAFRLELERLPGSDGGGRPGVWIAALRHIWN